jgi:ligand-binding SRPBCC domain-containing protein
MTFTKETRINASVERVFAFHESSEALTALIPPWENMRVAESSGSLLPGSRVVLRGSVGPIPVKWVAVHTEYDPPRLFTDEQQSGPFKLWHHRHRFIDTGDGSTILRDEVTYELPLGMVGRCLGGWFVRRKLERMFTFRHEVTRKAVEGKTVDRPGASSC